jgi:hypothetical protein
MFIVRILFNFDGLLLFALGRLVFRQVLVLWFYFMRQSFHLWLEDDSLGLVFLGNGLSCGVS